MPAAFTYPGVYVEELPNGVHPIAGVATSNTAFVDYFSQGPLLEPLNVTSFADFSRQFGGLNSLSEASYGVQQFFLNGGTSAWIVRITDAGQPTATPPVAGNAAAPAKLSLSDSASTDVLDVTALSPGTWSHWGMSSRCVVVRSVRVVRLPTAAAGMAANALMTGAERIQAASASWTRLVWGHLGPEPSTGCGSGLARGHPCPVASKELKASTPLRPEQRTIPPQRPRRRRIA